MSAGLLVQVLVTGLAAGAAYALIGIGFALLHQLAGVIQLAHGDFAGAACFLALVLVAGVHPAASAAGTSTWSLALADAAAVAVTALAGAGLYLGLLRPFVRRGATVAWVGMVVAVAFAIEGVLAAAFPKEGYVLPDILPGHGAPPIDLGGGAVLPVRTCWMLAIAATLAVLATLWLRHSRRGRAMRAIADDRMAAQVTGLPVDRLVAQAFALATAMAAIAGLLAVPGVPLTPTTGLLLGLKGLAAALVARLGAPPRVLAAALALGVLESAVATLPSLPGPAWRDVVPIGVALAVAAFRPVAPPQVVE